MLAVAHHALEREHHFVHRVGWLRAAVLGANDGIVSTASLIVGVAAAEPDRATILIAGVAGLVAGAMSMAAGEYVSVSSQSDTERADLETAPQAELEELAQIYAARGVEIGLAREVSAQLMDHDALGAHARDELGISEIITFRPIQAALTSAATFSIGAVLPLAAVAIAPMTSAIPVVAVASLASLASLGAVSAWAGGASPLKAAVRVTLWGVLAMAATAGIGALVGKVV